MGWPSAVVMVVVVVAVGTAGSFLPPNTLVITK